MVDLPWARLRKTPPLKNESHRPKRALEALPNSPSRFYKLKRNQ